MRAALLLLCGLLCGCGAPPSGGSYRIDDDGIKVKLIYSTPDMENGKAVFAARDGGHCILCHVHADVEAPFQGNVGPDLTFVGTRLTPAQLRLRIVDYDAVKPGTTMPSYYRTHNLNQVAEEHTGQVILSAREIEDIVAFLAEEEPDP